MNGPPTLKRCDLHVHTRHSAWGHLTVVRARDSYADPVDVFRRAKAAGMDFVAITDHDSIEGALRLRDALPERAGEILVGEEVSSALRFASGHAQWIHVNVFGVDEAAHLELQRLRGDARDLVAYCRGRGLLHVLNHPFQSYGGGRLGPRAYVDAILELFSHVEIGNGAMPPGHAAAGEALLTFAAREGLPKVAVGGSDSHVAARAGTSYTEAHGQAAETWLAAVGRGACRHVVRPIGLPALLLDVYRAVGRYYAELIGGVGREGMTMVNYVAAAGLAPAAILGTPAAVTIANRLRQAAAAHRIERCLAAAEAPALAVDPQGDAA